VRVTIASGKGGTGKTFVSSNLAYTLAKTMSIQYIDCDVEEPDGHLFLKPVIETKIPVYIDVPEVDQDRCTHCGECSNICQFNAIASLENVTIVFPELCHACGGCVWICPAGALAWTQREVGIVETGQAGKLSFVQGRLNVSESQSPPVIHATLSHASPDILVIVDAPPGTSCPAIAALRGSDLALFVAEPTPFGLHDLSLAVEMVRALGIPAAVILNRDGAGDTGVEEYCNKEEIPIWEKIPYNQKIAEVCSRGGLAV
jgi:MinD superfamily P-loop ATPase